MITLGEGKFADYVIKVVGGNFVACCENNSPATARRLARQSRQAPTSFPYQNRSQIGASSDCIAFSLPLEPRIHQLYPLEKRLLVPLYLDRETVDNGAVKIDLARDQE